ncbi:protein MICRORCHIDIA 7 [Cajanus cajan]|uniref:MORC family CW-type zinc finger protein 4 n=1 Tax=Cajanus cajan TaxID=3821 RepID=A0A151RRF8_CAJCA|nr:protein MICRORCHIDIA 7 [Cajanus cajan]KYP45130.1 MORC family CW-type zinc finger protein 4 [Cajanus cajan]
MDACVKQELLETPIVTERRPRNAVVSVPPPGSVIELSSSDSDSDCDLDSVVASVVRTGDSGESPSKKRRTNDGAVVLPVGFLSPLPPAPPPLTAVLSLPAPERASNSASRLNSNTSLTVNGSKQFWKAGDYDGAPPGGSGSSTVGMDHVRVHPKFLHSNATSHKWALGAFAELLDNSLDEVCNGATYANVDMLINKKDGTRMLLVEDNGGGMDPDKMRQCMSLGYSVKSKLANTIGQYGNGFKTSTMRLGADVIVFSRYPGKDGKSSTQSIGLLSYTFLRSTGKEDIVVPMLDYERRGQEWNKIIRTSLDDWNKNVETIVQWSPFSDEADLLRQFNLVKDHGTRVIIYNLWEDDQGQLELDFDADPHDIQIRGVNRDEKNIQMAKEFPNSRHFLTYRHSLRSYASILYLRLPVGFRIILRGKDILHHNIVNDMMMSQEVTYRPQSAADGLIKDSNMIAVVTIGFVKDAVHHVDVSGFNVYHKNRLIKPFWRIWNPAGSGGRGVIGVLEANFVEPAHDKQGFERTLVLSRLESKLIQMQKKYWSTNCHKIGYASNRSKILIRDSADKETSPDLVPELSQSKRKFPTMEGKATQLTSDKLYSQSNQKRIQKQTEKYSAYTNGQISVSPKRRIQSSSEQSSSEDDVSDNGMPMKKSQTKYIAEKSFENENGCSQDTSIGKASQYTRGSKLKGKDVDDGEQPLSGNDLLTLEQLKKENRELKERLQRKEEEILGDVLQALQVEKDRCKSLETQLNDAEKRIEELNNDQETLIDVFSEERDRRDSEEKSLRKKLQEASNTIEELLEKIRMLERKSSSGRLER